MTDLTAEEIEELIETDPQFRQNLARTIIKVMLKDPECRKMLKLDE